MKTAIASLSVTLVAVVLVGSKPASGGDHRLDLSVGGPDMPVHIAGTIGDPNIRNLDITIGDPGIAPPVVDIRPSDGLHIVVSPTDHSCPALPPGPC